MSNIKIFISYSHDSEEHKEKVLRLATRLIESGIDCEIDQFINGTPEEGWPRWMVNKVAYSDFVLIVSTNIYKERFEGKILQGRGKGSLWEGAVITQELYESETKYLKFIPIVFDQNEVNSIPGILKAATYYNIGDPLHWEGLYRYISGQPKIIKPLLGNMINFEIGINYQTNVAIESKIVLGKNNTFIQVLKKENGLDWLNGVVSKQPTRVNFMTGYPYDFEVMPVKGDKFMVCTIENGKDWFVRLIGEVEVCSARKNISEIIEEFGRGEVDFGFLKEGNFIEFLRKFNNNSRTVFCVRLNNLEYSSGYSREIESAKLRKLKYGLHLMQSSIQD